ncbi:hypothetical protein LguiA_035783 [Lonicera macranthoides]
MRAPCCDKSKVKKGAWSEEEDLRLISFIRSHGHPNWRSLPSQAGLLRCGKSCRLRWINYLSPDVKRGSFTPQEEHAIINLHHSLGNKWSKIASHFPGRTDNEIKNVWNTHLKKRSVAVKDDHATYCDTKESSSLIFPSPSNNSSTTTGEKEINNHNNNNVITGQPSCSSSSSTSSINSSSYDDLSSRPRRSGNELLGNQVVDADNQVEVIIEEEVPLECDTNFWDMLDSLEFELEEEEEEAAEDQNDIVINNNNIEAECNKWMRCLENELPVPLEY